jgi:cyclophilin family peptidyl-prolyl cis-trans isomerase
MNYKITLVLIVMLAVVSLIGVIITTSGGRSTPERTGAPRIFAFQAEEDDIISVSITHEGKTQTFVESADGRTWYFDELDGEEVFRDRWGGIPLLLSGPLYQRVIAEQSTDLGPYGLDEPSLIVSLGLQGVEKEVEIRIGDKTPQAGAHYVQFINDPRVYLVDATWGDVLTRLAVEPPRLPPTPEPATATSSVPRATATPAPPGPTAIEPTQEVRRMTYSAPPEMTIDTSKDYFAVFETANGTFRVELFVGDAPTTVNNFVFLAREGYYNDTTFHRVLPGFMAQAGDPAGTGAGGPGYQFADEFSSRQHDGPGVLSMANAGPNTNGSQFFITYVATPHLNGLHSVFGQVVEGMEIVEGIRPRDPGRGSPPPGDRLISITIEEIG